MLIAARRNVDRAAQRLDRAVASVEQQSDGLCASWRRSTPLMLLGGGIAAGLLLYLLPRPLRRAAVFAVAPAVLRHAWPATDDHSPP